MGSVKERQGDVAGQERRPSGIHHGYARERQERLSWARRKSPRQAERAAREISRFFSAWNACERAARSGSEAHEGTMGGSEISKTLEVNWSKFIAAVQARNGEAAAGEGTKPAEGRMNASRPLLGLIG